MNIDIDAAFRGYGVAIRREDEPPIPGEPFVPISDAKEICRNMILAVEMDKVALVKALQRMVYEATHLSPMKPNGDHECTVKADALALARATLAKHGGSDV